MAAILPLLFTTACTGDLVVPEADSIEAPSHKFGMAAKAAKELTVSPASSSLEVGGIVKLEAVDWKGETVSPSWSSSDTRVATVSSSGRLTARGAGSATITAKSRSTSGKASVKVTAPASDPEEDEPEGDGSRGGTVSSPGLWIGRAELAGLPTSGAAWDNLKKMADGSCPSFDLADQDNTQNTCVMAKALVYARTGKATYLAGVLEGLTALAGMRTYDGRALALGRNLAAYVIAADLVDLPVLDPVLDASLKTKLKQLRTTYTSGAASSLIDCHEKRPNNWGTHCGASRMAVSLYLGDSADFDRAVKVFRGYLGDRSAYAGFSFGGPAGDQDHSWECDPSRPVGINPKGCTKEGRSIDGVLPDDQRRAGSFTWPPPQENYVYEALQGALAQAVLVQRQGLDAFGWSDRALLRAFQWLHTQAGFAAEGDDTWEPHVVNHYYGTSFPAPVPSRHGKNVGWTDWTHPR